MNPDGPAPRSSLPNQWFDLQDHARVPWYSETYVQCESHRPKQPRWALFGKQKVPSTGEA